MVNMTNQQKSALNIVKVQTIKNAIQSSDVKRFENSLHLAELIGKAHQWIKDAEGQALLKSSGLGMDAFILDVYGFQKSFYYKLVKAANVPADVLSEFRKQTEALKAKDLSAPLSIEALLKYASEAKLETQSEAGEDGEAGEASAKEVQAKAQAVVTLAFKVDGLEAVALRINDNGELITKASPDAIAAALDYLAQAVAGAGLSPKAPKVTKAKAKNKVAPKPSTAKAPKPRKAEILKAVADGLTFEDVTFEDVI
jgi:DNA-binding NarL/FixJ family response regulator